MGKHPELTPLTPLTESRRTIWQYEKIPKSWRRGLIIEPAKKGNTKQSNNWTGITLLSVVAKIPCRIIIDSIRRGVDCRLRKEQARYRKGKGTTEQMKERKQDRNHKTK